MWSYMYVGHTHVSLKRVPIFCGLDGVLIPCSVFSISRASKASKHGSALEFAFYEFVFFIGFEFQLHISLVLKQEMNANLVASTQHQGANEIDIPKGVDKVSKLFPYRVICKVPQTEGTCPQFC